jgi:hypothetical protein
MSMDKQPQGIFQCFDTTLSEISPDVLGLWATVRTPSSQALAFGTTLETMTQPPLWCADLPGELHLATRHLADAETRLQASEKALAASTHRLDVFIAMQRSGVAFDVSSQERTLPGPEFALAAMLRELHEGRSPVSFGVWEWLGGGWEQAAQPLQAILERLRRLVAYDAWVETRVQQELLGQTTIGWTGDVNTVWRLGISAAEVMLHQRTLALALQSRDTLLQTLAKATQFAVKLAQLSLLLGTPGGVILALPVAWKFINEVLAEVGQP